MFKHFLNFADVIGTDAHPGQPVHSDLKFDVWRNKAGQFVLYPAAAGEPLTFLTLDQAIKHAVQAQIVDR